MSADPPWRTCLHKQGWDASGSELVSNYYHDGSGGIRWKSSNSIIRNNDFREVRCVRALWMQVRCSSFVIFLTPTLFLLWVFFVREQVQRIEVTPLQHYLEGTLFISNVSIEGNRMDPDHIIICQGVNHPTPDACENIRVMNNSKY